MITHLTQKNQTQETPDFVIEDSNQVYNIQKAIDDKSTMILKELRKIETQWTAWTNQQMGILLMNVQLQQKQKLKLEVTELTQSECNQSSDEDRQELMNKQNMMTNYIQMLKIQLIDQQGFQLMTQIHIQKFFDEFQEEVENKMHLFGDIQKLKLHSSYPIDKGCMQHKECKSISKEKTITLKKWLLENYLTPHPTQEQVDVLSVKTGLSRKQIMNWFITARNSFERKNYVPKKFKTQVKQRFQELVSMKKIKKTSPYSLSMNK